MPQRPLILAKLGIPEKPWYHFSIDDVFDSLIEATDQNIPLLEHPYFAMLKECHDAYGTEVGLQLFFQKNINGKMRTLSEVRDMKQELANSGSWLRFGPHALDYDTSPYAQTPEEQMKLPELTLGVSNHFKP